jgi:hypothetical protein
MRVMMENEMSHDDQPNDSVHASRKPYATPQVMLYGHVKDIIQGGGGKKSDAAGTPPGGNSKASCWIAEQLYGVDDSRTWLLRAWLGHVYDDRGRGWQFVALYQRFGRATARLIARGYLPRAPFYAVFDALLESAFDASAIAAARRLGA